MTKLSYEYRSSHCYSYVFGRSISFRQTEAFQVPTSLKYVIALCGILYSASRIYFLPVMSIFNGHLAVVIWQKWTTYMYYTILYYTTLYCTLISQETRKWKNSKPWKMTSAMLFLKYKYKYLEMLNNSKN